MEVKMKEKKNNLIVFYNVSQVHTTIDEKIVELPESTIIDSFRNLSDVKHLLVERESLFSNFKYGDEVHVKAGGTIYVGRLVTAGTYTVIIDDEKGHRLSISKPESIRLKNPTPSIELHFSEPKCTSGKEIAYLMNDINWANIYHVTISTRDIVEIKQYVKLVSNITKALIFDSVDFIPKDLQITASRKRRRGGEAVYQLESASMSDEMSSSTSSSSTVESNELIDPIPFSLNDLTLSPGPQEILQESAPFNLPKKYEKTYFFIVSDYSNGTSAAKFGFRIFGDQENDYWYPGTIYYFHDDESRTPIESGKSERVLPSEIQDLVITDSQNLNAKITVDTQSTRVSGHASSKKVQITMEFGLSDSFDKTPVIIKYRVGSQKVTSKQDFKRCGNYIEWEPDVKSIFSTSFDVAY